MKEFEENGYVVIRELLSKEQIEKIKTEIHSIFKAKMDFDNFSYETNSNGYILPEYLVKYYSFNKDGYIGCMREIQRIPIIYKLGASEELISKVKSVGLKKPSISQEPILMMNNQNTARKTSDWKTPVHQDWRSRQGSLNSVTMWIALVDITEQLGPVEIIPSSHLNGLLPTESDEWFMHTKENSYNSEEFKAAPINAGDALIFSQLLIHRSGNNSSNEFRYSLQFRYDDVLESNFMKRNFPNSRGSAPSTDLITPNFPSSQQVKEFFKN